MCTVTYLPVGDDSFIFTSNRDESSIRATVPPVVTATGSGKLLFPRDERAGGTWICLSEKNRLVNVLNGAFERHDWNPPYRKSRGLVALDLFKYPQTEDFATDNDFKGIEPFTLVIYEYGRLLEFRWDGENTHLKSNNVGHPHIWSSAQLYPKEMREKREQWFKDWLKGREEFIPEEILYFHQHGGEGDKENDFVMNRYGLVQTVSITCIIKGQENGIMRYYDLINNATTEASIKISGAGKIPIEQRPFE